MPRKSFWISLALTLALATVASLVATPSAAASPALAAPGAAGATATSHARAPLTNNTNCKYNQSWTNCDGYDTHGSNCGFVDGSYGAYWVGNYSGEINYVQIWWDPACNTNFIYVNAPSAPKGQGLCGGQDCTDVGVVTFFRATSNFSAGWCNTGGQQGPNYQDCLSSADHGCNGPGMCGTNGSNSGYALSYCAKKYYRGPDVYCSSSFNNEYIGVTTWWPTFVTDMFYAPNQPVMACAILVSVSKLVTFSNQVCSMWH
jgi:hypothetical protein